MSDIIETVQLQDPGSAIVELYVLEYAPNTFAYFHAGKDGDAIPQDVQFRDYDGSIQTYVALPMEAEGFDVSSDGAYSRPTLSVANVLSTFSDEIGGLDYEQLIGKRLTRRLTLEKYLVGEVSDATPPVEFPSTVFVIDRIKERNVLSITFELAAPFDVAGVTLPKRQVVGGACPWLYTGAAPEREDYEKKGGCKWSQYGKYYIDGVERTLFFSSEDIPIVPSSAVAGATAWSSSSTAGTIYSYGVSGSKYYDGNGELQSTTATTYWVAVSSGSSTPAMGDDAWQRVLVYSAYDAATTYFVYIDPLLNSIVSDTVGSDTDDTLWQVRTVTQVANNHQRAPGYNKFWQRADVCGKTITSCKTRFHAALSNGIPNPTQQRSQIPLPFGGFPGARRFR